MDLQIFSLVITFLTAFLALFCYFFSGFFRFLDSVFGFFGGLSLLFVQLLLSFVYFFDNLTLSLGGFLSSFLGSLSDPEKCCQLQSLNRFIDRKIHFFLALRFFASKAEPPLRWHTKLKKILEVGEGEIAFTTVASRGKIEGADEGERK
jgi:hypothetical protein